MILAKPKAVTDIEFSAEEKITTVAGGDTKNWELTPTQSRHHLFIKPIYEQIETPMTVITDKRSYQFVLRSTGPGAKWYQRVTGVSVRRRGIDDKNDDCSGHAQLWSIPSQRIERTLPRNLLGLERSAVKCNGRGSRRWTRHASFGFSRGYMISATRKSTIFSLQTPFFSPLEQCL